MIRFIALLAIAAAAFMWMEEAVASEAAPELNDQERAQLAKALEGWQPLVIEREGDGRLVVVLPQNRITATIHSAVVRAGLCFGKLLHSNYVAFDQLAVLNRHAFQGFVWEGTLSDCDLINGMPSGEVAIAIAAETHPY